MDCECLLGTAHNSQSLKSNWNHYSSFSSPHWFLCGTCFSSLPLLKIQFCKDRGYHWEECSMILTLKLNYLALVICTPSDTCWEYFCVFLGNRKCFTEPLWVHCRSPGVTHSIVWEPCTKAWAGQCHLSHCLWFCVDILVWYLHQASCLEVQEHLELQKENWVESHWTWEPWQWGHLKTRLLRCGSLQFSRISDGCGTKRRD